MELTSSRTHLVAALLAALAFVVVLALVGDLVGTSVERTIIVFLVSLTAISAMGLYSGNSGILSFGHLSFMGVGAYVSALLTLPTHIKEATLPALPGWLASTGLGLWPATLVAVLVTMAVAVVVGLAIWRLEGSAATIATLALLIITHGILIGWRDVTRGAQTFFGVPRDTTIWVAAIGCFVALIISRLYRDSAWGLRLRAGRENATAAASVGISVPRERFIALVLSAGLMALSGALIAHFLGAFSPKKFYFTDTFFLLAMLIVGGMTTVSGPVLGAAVVTLITEILRRLEGGLDLGFMEVPQVFGTTQIGIGVLILLALMHRKDGLAGMKEWEEWLIPTRRAAVNPKPLSPAESAPVIAENVTRRFGGLLATNKVSLTVRPGEILGLIGPNGSGKTTLLNQISGVLPPSSGKISRGEQDLLKLPSHKFADAGIARTFQNIRLFPTLTVYQNIQVAALSSKGGRDAAARVAGALQWLGLEAVAETDAGTLSYGDQRRVEIARALVCQPSLIFLDEPAAGMNREETDALMDILRRINTDLGIGILLVDHDLALINALCHRIAVLNEGRMIAEGTPEEVRSDPAVIEAYLGTFTKQSTVPT
ncbi:MAG: branched-chain amino acid ABC transporter ATP-binding protein/permease [Rhodobacteraceae bacterium]|nr:branched-chain amino acid ABC transporter ATP-binding protein/permease [Paracoccaceae bacterium]